MSQQQNTMTVIGPDTTIKGEMSFETGAQILGTFEGKISSRGEVQVGESAVCRASIEAGSVVIEGELQGDVQARERIHLSCSARMRGDLTARTLVVTEGASFNGQCNVGPDVLEAAEGDEPEVVVQAAPPKKIRQAAPQTEDEEPFGDLGTKIAELGEETANNSRKPVKAG
jgi:cytoskeletal protein CcmA (bactofilin family)